MEREGHMKTETETEIDASARQKASRIAGRHQSQKRARTNSPLEPLKGTNPANTLVSDFWFPEM